MDPRLIEIIVFGLMALLTIVGMVVMCLTEKRWKRLSRVFVGMNTVTLIAFAVLACHLWVTIPHTATG